MTCSTLSRRERTRGAASFAAIMGLAALMAVLAILTLSLGTTNLRTAGQSAEDARLSFLETAALEHAYAEIRAELDLDGDGGIGSVSTGVLTGANGAVIGGYRTWVVNQNPTPNTTPVYHIRAQVGVPTLAAAEAGAPNSQRRVAEARLTWDPQFALNPKVGAISIAGPLTSDPDLSNWNSANFSVNGVSPGADGLYGPQPGPDGILGTPDDVNDDEAYPAVVFTDADARTNFVEDNTIDVDFFTNGLNTKLTGGPNETFNRPGTPATFDAPFSLQPDAAFSSDMLNDYRDALRTYAEDLVHTTVTGTGTDVTASFPDNYAAAEAAGVVVVHKQADVKDGNGTGKPRLVNANYTYGDVNNKKVVLLDSSKFDGGHEVMTSNHAGEAGGSTITGAGTLVILHPVGSRSDNANGKSFNLNWTGDVFVIGYPKDRSTGVGTNAPTDNLLYLSRADWNVTGNVVVVTAGATEASLEMQGTSANPANLQVNGSVLLFGEASTQESEIDIEAHANFQVNGVVGLYGSRVEIENQSSTNTTLKIDGTLAMGFPTGSTRNDDLRLKVAGDADFRFNRANVESAVESLSELQQNLNLSNEDLETLTFHVQNVVLRSATSWSTLSAEFGALTARGVDLTLVKAHP